MKEPATTKVKTAPVPVRLELPETPVNVPVPFTVSKAPDANVNPDPEIKPVLPSI